MILAAIMNIAELHPAENLPPRRAFSADDVRRMLDAGVIHEAENFELIEGEIVMMASKSVAHDNMKNALLIAFARHVPAGLYVGVESTLQLAEDVLVDPDIAVVDRRIYKTSSPTSFAQPAAEDVLLVIEIAVSSMDYDRKVKSRLYARHGIREYWVIDALERITWIHTGPRGDDWASITEHGAAEMLTTAAVPGLTIRLDEIA